MYSRSCAHKYDRCQEMVSAALAYKCMEVAYMRLVYCKHSSINRDRHELQSALQMVSQGNHTWFWHEVFISSGLLRSLCLVMFHCFIF